MTGYKKTIVAPKFLQKSNNFAKGKHQQFETLYSVSNVSYSSDGELLVSTDNWGNIVIRNTDTYQIKCSYSVDCHSCGAPMSIVWLPYYNNGLIIEAKGQDDAVQTFFIDTMFGKAPQKIKGIAEGERFWGDANILLVLQHIQIMIYQYE